jgi:hypothetical protein
LADNSLQKLKNTETNRTHHADPRNAQLRRSRLAQASKEMPMPDLHRRLSQLQRPRLLIRAARHGQGDYRRDRDLGRLIGAAAPLSPQVSVLRLLSEEEHLEGIRRQGDAAYSIARHIDVLIALMAEARLLPRDGG